MKLALIAANAQPLFDGQAGTYLLVALVKAGEYLTSSISVLKAPAAVLVAGSRNEMVVEVGQLTGASLD